MKKMILTIAALAAHSALGAAAQMRNISFSAPFPTSPTVGMALTAYLEVTSGPNGQTYYAAAFGGSSAPTAASAWVADESGIYDSTKATPTNSCPGAGIAGPSEGAVPAWHAIEIPLRLPPYFPCSPAPHLIIVVNEGPMSGCYYDQIVWQMFGDPGMCVPPTATSSPTSTSTPTSAPATGTSTVTPTQTAYAGTPTRTPASSASQTRSATFSPSPTSSRTPAASATATAGTPAPTQQASEPAILSAAAIPNPNPWAVAFQVQGDPDEVRISVFSAGYVKAWEATVPGNPSGWRKAPIPTWAAPGSFFVRVSAIKGGRDVSSAICRAFSGK